jgi:hypothetical protein
MNAGDFWEAHLHLWGLFFENPAPPGCDARSWRRLECAAFRIHESLSCLPLVGAEERAVRMARVQRAVRECQLVFATLDATIPLVHRARLWFAQVTSELEAQRRRAPAA